MIKKLWDAARSQSSRLPFSPDLCSLLAELQNSSGPVHLYLQSLFRLPLFIPVLPTVTLVNSN